MKLANCNKSSNKELLYWQARDGRRSQEGRRVSRSLHEGERVTAWEDLGSPR